MAKKSNPTVQATFQVVCAFDNNGLQRMDLSTDLCHRRWQIADWDARRPFLDGPRLRLRWGWKPWTMNINMSSGFAFCANAYSCFSGAMCTFYHQNIYMSPLLAMATYMIRARFASGRSGLGRPSIPAHKHPHMSIKLNLFLRFIWPSLKHQLHVSLFPFLKTRTRSATFQKANTKCNEQSRYG